MNYNLMSKQEKSVINCDAINLKYLGLLSASSASLDSDLKFQFFFSKALFDESLPKTFIDTLNYEN